MIQAITDRRSIRKYQDKPVPREMVEEIITAGMLAPSAKNRQPWKFVVVTEGAKEGMLAALIAGLAREKKEPFLAESACHLDGAEYTFSIMKQASVVIFIINPLAKKFGDCLSQEDRIAEICNTQSVGAAIENMTLAATNLGLGSLWICDTFFAQKELDEWLNVEGELFAALTIGYANEAPDARPRKEMESIVEWRER